MVFWEAARFREKDESEGILYPHPEPALMAVY
jgi:hypothetical protein